jgi:hypothetical protein
MVTKQFEQTVSHCNTFTTSLMAYIPYFHRSVSWCSYNCLSVAFQKSHRIICESHQLLRQQPLCPRIPNENNFISTALRCYLTAGIQTEHYLSTPTEKGLEKTSIPSQWTKLSLQNLRSQWRHYDPPTKSHTARKLPRIDVRIRFVLRPTKERRLNNRIWDHRFWSILNQ